MANPEARMLRIDASQIDPEEGGATGLIGTVPQS
jgi:hypothetical protein